MLCIPSLDIALTSRAFLQDHRRKSYLQPINWSVLSSGDGPQENSMETDAMLEANQFTGGVYATTSSQLIGGTQSTHSLSQAEFASLNLHLEESELIDEDNDDFVGGTPISGPTAQSRTYNKNTYCYK